MCHRKNLSLKLQVVSGLSKKKTPWPVQAVEIIMALGQRATQSAGYSHAWRDHFSRAQPPGGIYMCVSTSLLFLLVADTLSPLCK